MHTFARHHLAIRDLVSWFDFCARLPPGDPLDAVAVMKVSKDAHEGSRSGDFLSLRLAALEVERERERSDGGQPVLWGPMGHPEIERPAAGLWGRGPGGRGLWRWVRAIRVSVAFLEKIGRGGVGVDLEQVGVGVEGRGRVEVDDAGFPGALGGEEGEGLFGVGFVGGVQARVVVPCGEHARVSRRAARRRVLLYEPEMTILSL